MLFYEISLFTLFLDESGDDGDYYNILGSPIQGSSKFLTVGGIMVQDKNIQRFESLHKTILEKYFVDKGIELESNFKLHYSSLKRNKKPYNRFNFEEKCELAHDIFEGFQNIDSSLFFCTIDIKNHCDRYTKPVNPKSYALLVCYEKFEMFKDEQSSSGKVVYEEFNHIRHKVGEDLKTLFSYNTFPNPLNLSNIEKNIISGKPSKYPILQFADFIANCIWSKYEYPNHIHDRFNLLLSKMKKFSNGDSSCQKI